MRRARRPRGRHAAWHCNGLLAHVCLVLNTLGLAPVEPVLSALCRAVEAASYGPFLNVLETLLGVVFPDREGVRFEPDPSLASGERVVFRDPATLTADQRQALEAVVRNPYWLSKSGFGPHEELLWEFGIPTDVDRIRQLVATT